MKVLFLTEGGRHKGLGHIARCAALAEGIRETAPDADIRFICEGDDLVKGILKDRHINLVLDEWNKSTDQSEACLRGHDFVVIDSYTAGRDIYEKATESASGKTLFIDDNKRIEYPEGLVLNPSAYAPALDYPAAEGVKCLLGKDYVLLRKDFWDVPANNIGQDLQKAMITLGGTAPPELLGRLEELLKDDYGLAINKIDPSRGVASAADMIASAKDSDICVSGAGQTLYELLRIGLPTIAVELADNQKLNVASLAEMGFIERAGSSDDAGLEENLSKALRNMMEKSRREKISSTGREAIDGKGALRTARIIINEVKKDNAPVGLNMRKAENRDCYDVWAWRNDPVVRKWSFSSDIIEFGQHRKWFVGKLGDERESIYIAENDRKDKVGQARFSKGPEGAYISVNLNPAFMGRRLGSELIDSATAAFLNKNPEEKEIRAKIKNDNIASKKAFDKAGYALDEEGERFSVYIKKGIKWS